MKAGDYVIYNNGYDNTAQIVQLEEEEYEEAGVKFWCGVNDTLAFFDMPTNRLFPIKLPFLIRLREDEDHEFDTKVISIDYEKKTVETINGRNDPLERDWFDSLEEYLEYMEDFKEHNDNTDTFNLFDIHPLITSGK